MRAADFAAQSNDLVQQLKILDGHIAGKNWFALDRLTLADISLARVFSLSPTLASKAAGRFGASLTWRTPVNKLSDVSAWEVRGTVHAESSTTQ